MKSKGRKDKPSLYGNSMNVVANLIKMSSFSLANKSVGAAVNGPVLEPRNNLQPEKSFVMAANNPTRKLHEAKTESSRQISYVVSEDYRSSHVTHEDMNVDGRASEYIRKSL
ncbi:hypothetical protein FNV43_RR19893 [Rhamnella rubrinervis]|uniref:Uncharacterized protein n=1 Tax=Rhamnella rubrinervis TaxID=2594499 RepID=A0A8K0GWL9_9ROSA|nr:hypothetical protein FNV43_RR19893 [Rhamnella rubrinervis]